MTKDLNRVTAGEAAARIRRGELSSTMLVAAALRRAEETADLNAFITLDHEGATAAAARADARPGAGLLHGVPLVIKDNIHVAGLPCSAGTPALRQFVPDAHAPVVQRLVDAGAIIVGKTNMHELAFGVSGYNEAFHGARIGVRNPLDPARICGGSSSGTAAAIAAGVVAAGLGTDTGASVRLPAAYTNGAALRPTVQRYSQKGICPISHTRDTPGPMARTVGDVALLHGVISGRPVVTACSPRGVRLGVHRDWFFASMDSDTAEVTGSVLERLRAAGMEMIEVDMPDLGRLEAAVSFPVAVVEAYDDLVSYLREWSTGVDIRDLVAQIASEDVRAIYETMVLPLQLPGPSGMEDARPAYQHALTVGRPGLRKLYADTFARHRLDALIFPTAPVVPMLQGPSACSPDAMGRMIQNTGPGSNAGIPGLSVPGGFGRSGLPVGIEIDGPDDSDERLLAIGLAIEEVLAGR